MNTEGEYTATRAPHPELPKLTALTLASPAGVVATFVPEAGMVGSSLTRNGVELLGQRQGLTGYLTHGSTFGIPLLAPWANRLVAHTFDGVSFEPLGAPGGSVDENGLPIHGVLAGCDAWDVVQLESGPDDAVAVATLSFDPGLGGFKAFPFEHQLRIRLRLSAATLSISTTITATGSRRVPVCFGWHPYFAPPGAPRPLWRLHSPFTERLVLNELLCPTGAVATEQPKTTELGDPESGGVTLDTLFGNVAQGAVAWIEGADTRISLSYDEGYPFGVLFAPPDQDLVAIEPMTAPTDPLAGHFPIQVVAPGQSRTATFSITVSDVEPSS